MGLNKSYHFGDIFGRLRRVVSRHILRRFGVFCSLGFPQLLRVFFVVWSWWRWRYWSRMACYATVSDGKPRGLVNFTTRFRGGQVPQPCCERNRLVSSVPNCSATRVAQTACVKTRPCTNRRAGPLARRSVCPEPSARFEAPVEIARARAP